MKEVEWRNQLALKSYRFPGGLFDQESFKEDFGKIGHLCKMLKANRNEREINSRIILNYFIIGFNQFGDSFLQLLCSICDSAILPCVVASLSYLNRMPKESLIVFDRLVDLNQITADPVLFCRFVKECSE